jgi:RNA polymerase subunit RPABC4/transcription elongation factor Spt4
MVFAPAVVKEPAGMVTVVEPEVSDVALEV